jgi:antitoxin HicB
MRLAYPYLATVEPGATVLEFPDVPGALTEVREGEDFLALARDCLAAALGGHIARKAAPPLPSPARGRPTVSLDLLTSAKLALASAMHAEGVTNVALAGRLGVDERIVRRMLDPDCRTRIDRLETALGLLGQELELTIKPTCSGQTFG